MIAAAKALTTRSVSAVVLRPPAPGSDEMRIPASAASENPRAHDSIEARSGRPPLSRSRSRSSTRARIAVPVTVL